MKAVDNQYFTQVKLPKSPYVDNYGNNTAQLPAYPPKALD